MTGTDRIKNKILEDAKLKASQIEDQANKEAGKIVEDAKKSAGDKRESILKLAEEQGAETYRRLLAVAALEGRKETLRAKQKMVETAFKTALDTIVSLPDREYQKLLENLAAEAAGSTGGEILLSKGDIKRLDSQFVENINKRLTRPVTLSNETVNAVGGLIVRQGEMEINSTFEILFSMIKPQLEDEVVTILFGS